MSYAHVKWTLRTHTKNVLWWKPIGALIVCSDLICPLLHCVIEYHRHNQLLWIPFSYHFFHGNPQVRYIVYMQLLYIPSCAMFIKSSSCVYTCWCHWHMWNWHLEHIPNVPWWKSICVLVYADLIHRFLHCVQNTTGTNKCTCVHLVFIFFFFFLCVCDRCKLSHLRCSKAIFWTSILLSTLWWCATMEIYSGYIFTFLLNSHQWYITLMVVNVQHVLSQ